MAKKNLKKESPKALLASVRKEMALPRMVESTRNKIANAAAAKGAETHP